MNPERGPLPPLPEPKDYGMSPGTWDASDMHAYAIAYAIAEVARLAGQAVAVVSEGGTIRWFVAEELRPGVGARLGVIATPSAKGTT